AMRSALSASSSPRSAFTRAAAPLMRPSQRATGAGIGSPETGKLAIAFVVSAPQSSRVVSVRLTEASLAAGRGEGGGGRGGGGGAGGRGGGGGRAGWGRSGGGGPAGGRRR